ncbi:MAG TPA: histidine kinase, partial [Segetibacter sp.]
CYDPQTKTYEHFYSETGSKSVLPSNVIDGIAIDRKGRIWVGGRGCFGYFVDSAKNFTNLNQNGNPSESNYDSRVYYLYADRNGDIWAGTDAGLYYYEANKTVPALKKMYNADNGMRGDIVSKIQEDSRGDIWCITNSAVCKINIAKGNIITFGKLDGIDKINSLESFFLFNNGKIALLSQGGYYIFDPSSFLQKRPVVPVAVTSFKIDDEEQFFENKIAAHEKIVVPANANVISFEYAALDFDRPDKQQYAYILEGSDKDWVMAGTRRYVGYSNLPGGDYVFKVKATHTPDNWDVPVVSIPIHVEQPFYKTWWFILATIAVIIVSLDTFYRFKLEKQQQILRLETKTQILQKEKALVMYESLKQQLNPHFLFNSLTSLSSLIRYDQEKAGDFLDALSKIYRYILKSRHNETVTLAEEINFVQTFIKLQQTRFDHGLIVNINIPKEFEHCKIPPVTLQNLIENAIKHNIIDEDSPLVIDIYTEDDYIIVRNNLQRKNFVETSNKQ